jgi:hypothetical protein
MEKRSKSHLWRLGAAVGAAVLLIGVLAVYASAGPIGVASGFEDDDGKPCRQLELDFRLERL